MRSEDDKKYLANKHKGGTANSKGLLYEDYYAVLQIASCVAYHFKDCNSISFQTQLEDAYVDDLLIKYPNINVYHQLKNSKHLSWETKFSKRTIASDFEKQIEECEERKENFSLKLVHSSLNSKVENSIPKSISKYTITQYFPSYDDINSMVLSDENFQLVLTTLSANGKESKNDELCIIATIILGAWKALPNRNSLCLLDIVRKAEEVKHFNLSFYPPKGISDECAKILNAVEGLDFHIRGRMLYWKLGTVTGCCPWNEDKERMVIEKHPSTKLDFLMIF